MRIAWLAFVCAMLVACSLFAPAPSPTHEPEFVIPTPSPKPSVTATTFTGHYGFLVPSASGFAIRRENDTTVLGTIDASIGAVSPDGRYFAGWSQQAPWELRVIEVAKPTAIQKVLALDATERPLGVVWSVDETGLLFSVASLDTSGAGIGAPPKYSALRSVDLASVKITERARGDATWLRPALWDRVGGDLVGAFSVTPGAAIGYVVVRGNGQPERRPFASSTTWQETPAVDGEGGWVAVASLTDPIVKTFLASDPGFSLEYHGNAGGASAAGRPMSTQNAIVVDGEFLLWDARAGSRIRVGTVNDLRGVRFFRFDGSAAVVTTANGLGLLDMATGMLTALTGGQPWFAVALP